MIVILTGPIRTGKTTALRYTFSQDGCGIVQPVIKGRRHVLDLASGRMRPLEASPNTPDSERVPVGRFVFDATAFAWAAERLNNVVHVNPADGWVVLDEVGPLELAGQGMASATQTLVTYGEESGNVLFVVREGLVDAVTSRFHIRQPSIIRLGEALPGGRVVTALK